MLDWFFGGGDGVRGDGADGCRAAGFPAAGGAEAFAAGWISAGALGQSLEFYGERDFGEGRRYGYLDLGSDQRGSYFAGSGHWDRGYAGQPYGEARRDDHLHASSA